MFKRMKPESACWCGSGKEYKNCHMEFDKKVNRARRQGDMIPSHLIIKTPEQIEGIRESGKLNIAVLDYVAEHIKAGVTTEDINKWVHDYTVEHGGIPAPLGFEGFPKSVCTSINEEVCHGVPSENVVDTGDIEGLMSIVANENLSIKEGDFSLKQMVNQYINLYKESI